ncbi:hypothetical protein AOLI_G00319710 [Acnodon oligacanthus]
MDIYTTRCIRKATSIVDDPIHPSHGLFSPLPSGRSVHGMGNLHICEGTINPERRIVALHKDGQDYKKIANTLKLSCSTVAKIIQHFKRAGFTQNRPCVGRPKKLSAHGLKHVWWQLAEHDPLPPETGSQGSVPAWNNSPELNPTEHLCGILKRKVEERKVSNIRQLRDVVMEEWKSIPVATCEALTNFNMAVREPRRTAEDSTDSDDSNKERRPYFAEERKDSSNSGNKKRHRSQQRTVLPEMSEQSTDQILATRRVCFRRRGEQFTSSPESVACSCCQSMTAAHQWL